MDDEIEEFYRRLKTASAAERVERNAYTASLRSGQEFKDKVKKVSREVVRILQERGIQPEHYIRRSQSLPVPFQLKFKEEPSQSYSGYVLGSYDRLDRYRPWLGRYSKRRLGPNATLDEINDAKAAYTGFSGFLLATTGEVLAFNGDHVVDNNYTMPASEALDKVLRLPIDLDVELPDGFAEAA